VWSAFFVLSHFSNSPICYSVCVCVFITAGPGLPLDTAACLETVTEEKPREFGMRRLTALLLACAVQSSCGCMGDSLHDGNTMQPWHHTAS